MDGPLLLNIKKYFFSKFLWNNILILLQYEKNTGLYKTIFVSGESVCFSHEELMALKSKKKLIQTATELFNTKPSKGIAYLQEMKLIQPDEPEEVAQFLRTNPQLNKNQMGDYISRREHLHILKAFVESFAFTRLRIDASLRIFLESFR